MTAVLLWKEYREQRAIWVVFAILAVFTAVVLLGVMDVGSHPTPSRIAATKVYLFAVLLVVSMVYGMIVGASMLAGEKEAGTVTFLDRLHGHRTPVFVRKLAAGAMLAVSQGIWVAGLSWGLGWASWDTAICLTLAGLHGFAWGILASAIWSTGMAAVVGSLPFLAANSIVAFCLAALFATLVGRTRSFVDGPRDGLFFVLANVPLDIGAAFVAWRLFCKPDFTREPVSAHGGNGLWLFLPAGWRALTWLAVQQGRWVMIGGLVISLMLGFLVHLYRRWFFGRQPPWWDWPAAWRCSLPISMRAADSLGHSAFHQAKSGSRRCFCGARFASGACSWPGLSPRLKPRIGTTTIHFSSGEIPAGGLTHLLEILSCSWRFGRFTVFAWANLPVKSPGRDLTARFLALVFSPLLIAPWAPSLLIGGVPTWWVLSIPIVLLVATRLLMRPWMGGRLLTAKPIAGIAAAAALIVLSVAGFLWHRAVEVPDVGDPLDEGAFVAALDAAKKSEAGPLLRSAARALQEHGSIVNKDFTRPGERVADKVQGTWMFHNSRFHLHFPLEEHMETLKWLDRLFEGEWAKEAQDAAHMPLGVVIDARVVAPKRSLRYGTDDYETVGQLFVARARQQSLKGDASGALNHLDTALALSRQLMNFAPLEIYTSGHHIEQAALAAFHRWLEKAGPDKDLVRKGFTVLQKHAAVLPDAANTPKAEFLIYGNNEPLSLRGNTALGRLFRTACQAPWEQERLTRIVSAVAFSQIRELQKPDWNYSAWKKEGENKTLLRPYWLHNSSAVFSDNHFIARVSRGQQSLGAALIVTAAALYQLDHGSSPPRLPDLVPVYLPSLPIDRGDGGQFDYRVGTKEEVRGQPLAPSQGVIDYLEAGGGEYVVLSVPRWEKP